MSIVSAYNSSLNTRQLLVSVQNAVEARVALGAGVAWIDLKDPSQGSLGRPQPDTCHEFLRALEVPGQSNAVAPCRRPQVSIALGELRDIESDSLVLNQLNAWASEFPIVKVGLAAMPNEVRARRALQQLLERLSETVPANFGSPSPASRVLEDAVPRCQVVVAVYADWRRAEAAAPDVVLELARMAGSPYLLVDTCFKDGKGLFDHWSVGQLIELREQAASIGADLVVAGSLRESDWTRLDELGDVIIGVRGAVCSDASERSSQLCASRLSRWVDWVRRP